MTIATMLSTNRSRRVTCARHIAMYLSREVVVYRSGLVDRTGGLGTLAPPSFPRIGIAFSRDHSTVINACRTVTLRLRDDLGFALLLNRLALHLRDHAPAPAVVREAA